MISVMLLIAGAAATEEVVAAEEDDEPVERQAEPAEDREARPDLYRDRLASTRASSSTPVQLHAWAEAGYRLPVQGTEAQAGSDAYLSLARIQGKIQEDAFGAHLQVGADDGTPQLLDASVSWTPDPAFSLTAGRFKTPTSAEYLVPATQLIFIHRGLHMALVTRRALGALASLHTTGESPVHFTIEAGIFDPVHLAPLPGDGELFSGRVFLHSEAGLGLHLGGASWVHEEQALDQLEDDAPSHDRHLDGAVIYEQRGWTSVVEGAWARRTGSTAEDIGGIASVAHRFHTGKDGFDIEPGVAIEVMEQDGVHELAQAAVNLHWDDWHLVQTLEWEAELSPAGIDHAVYLQLQGGL